MQGKVGWAGSVGKIEECRCGKEYVRLRGANWMCVCVTFS